MQSSSIPSAVLNDNRTGLATILATCAAAAAVLSVPLALIPVLGLATSALILGFIAALTAWTHRKRAFFGTGIALLSCFLAAISTLLCLQGLLTSRSEATARVAQAQSQLEAMKAHASSSSERSTFADAIKMLGGNDVSEEQAKVWGGLAEWAVRAMSSDNNSDSGKK